MYTNNTKKLLLNNRITSFVTINIKSIFAAKKAGGSKATVRLKRALVTLTNPMMYPMSIYFEKRAFLNYNLGARVSLRHDFHKL